MSEQQGQAVAVEAADRREFGSLRLRGRIWWLRYRIDGKEHWESSKSASQKVAQKLLARRAAEVDAGVLTAPDAKRVSFADLEQMLRDHYRNEGNRSLWRAEYALKRLGQTLGTMRAVKITKDRVNAYEAERLDEGASRATINYELAVLRKMFNLAVDAGRLPSKPKIRTPRARNQRTGFFEPDDFTVVVEKLPAHLKPVMMFAYHTGWRVQSEVLPLTWDRVDFHAGVVRLEPNTTKNDEGREFPFGMLPPLAAMLKEQRKHTDAVERSVGRIIPHVFHRNGKPLKSYRHGWHAACRRAATSADASGLVAIVRPHLVDRIVHDFRRTAVRNLVRAGVPEHTAMKLTGHKTREVFDRYDIVSGADLRAGVAQLATHLANRETEQGKNEPKGTIGGQSPLQLVGGAKRSPA